MPITTMSAREFNQDVSKAKKAANSGPVFVTDRGRPSHVLLTIDEYQRLMGTQASIVDLLSMPSTAVLPSCRRSMKSSIQERSGSPVT